MNPRDGANPNCEECDGEGVVCYAYGEDGRDEPCQVCYKGMCWGDLDEDDRYDQWRDEQMEREDE